MNKELYEIVISEIDVYFGDGDCIEPCDKKACAERVVEVLEKAGYRKTDEVRKDTVAEIVKPKSALADAVRSFTRMETLYKLKCNELESAIDEIAGLTGKVEALQQDNENLRRTLEQGRSYEYRDSCVGCELADVCKYAEHYNFCEDCKEYPDCSCMSYDTLPCGRHIECNNGFEEKSYLDDLDDEDEEGEGDE